MTFLGEFASDNTTVKLVNGFLSEILAAGDVDSLQPALLTPAPRSNVCHPDLLQPFRETDNCAGNWC